MKILVIQQKMIGDVLTTSILFNELRAVFPDAQLDYLINSHTLPVVKHHPNINNFILFTKEIESSKKALLKFSKIIRQKEYDIVIDVYSKISSNVIAYYSKAKTKISYYKHYSAFIYTHNIKRKKDAETIAGLAIENRLQLLEPLGVKKNIATPKIYLTKAEIDSSRSFLIKNNINFNQPLFMISVLGSGQNKTYPFNYMADVIDTIVNESKGQILFNYIPNQASQAKEIFNLCKIETQKHILFDVFGESLRDFLAITHHCDALIGNEGGAVNMAKALNINTFTVFSPWIDKKTWSIFDDGKQNVSVHLKDYMPELYNYKAEKEMKKKALHLYQEFKPSFFQDKLQLFLTQNTLS